MAAAKIRNTTGMNLDVEGTILTNNTIVTLASVPTIHPFIGRLLSHIIDNDVEVLDSSDVVINQVNNFSWDREDENGVFVEVINEARRVDIEDFNVYINTIL